MLGPQNAQDFIRALKAPSDPPHVGGPLKIDIAREAWENTRLYIPNKAEAIVEWLLTRLLKDKAKDRHANSICDTRYWDLLAQILISSGGGKHGDHGRAQRAWLVPLLNRVPIAPIVLSCFKFASADGSLDTPQYLLVTKCIAILWPLAAPKFSPETLLECFGAAIHLVVALGGPELPDGSLQSLDNSRALSVIVSSYRGTLSNSGSKKKQLYTLFLEKYVDFWLKLATWSCGRESVQPQLASDIYDAGIETMFGLELLKPAADRKHDLALADALERILRTSPEIVLRPLPRMFKSYVHTIRRHRGALFGQGSSQALGQVVDQFQAVAIGFYSLCSNLARAGGEGMYWRCRVSLLEVVEKENLFNSKDDDAKTLLRQDGDLAIDALATAWDEQHASRTDSAVQILTLLTRIDYDLMSDGAIHVFPRLLALPPTVTSALRYLELLLEYDSKTRNLPSVIMHIAAAFSVQHLHRIPGSPRSAYELASAGPFTSLAFLDELSRAVYSFLTPGQVLDTIAVVSQTLKDALQQFLERDAELSADRGEGPRKRRKKRASTVGDRTEPEYSAVSFALMARTMVVVLRSLPLHTLTEDVHLEAVNAIGEVLPVVACRALQDALQSDKRSDWHWQMVGVGALRLRYGLVRMPELQRQLQLEQPVLTAMLLSVSEPGIAPELFVELFRTMLHQCTEVMQPEEVLDKLLAHLDVHLSIKNSAWTGKAHVLSTDAAGALALLHVLTDRWLPHFDAWSTPEQRKRFARILTTAKLDPAALHSRSGLTVPVVVSRMLHDAQFWELLNIRDALLAQLNEQTALLEELKLPALLSQRPSNLRLASSDDVLQFVSAYDVLALTPPEYLPRAMHIAFLKRGFAADILVFTMLRKAKESAVSARHLLVIREFLRRTIAYLGSVENVIMKEFLNYLIEHASVNNCSTEVVDEVISATMELINMYQGVLVRAAKRGGIEVLVELVTRYTELYAVDGLTIVRKASLLLIDSFVQEGIATNFPEETVRSLHRLCDRMLDYSMKHLTSSSSAHAEPPLDVEFLDTWSHVQTLRRWLKHESEDLPTLGRPLARRLLSWTGEKGQLTSLAPSVLAILLSEMQAAPAARHEEQLEYVVVAYLAFARLCERQDMKPLEWRLGSACRTLSADDFRAVLELVYNGIPLSSGLTVQDVGNLVQFSAVVLHDAPEGTSRICQSFITKSLHLFADDERYVTNVELRREVVDFVVRQCNDRPASLRVVDLPSLWSLLRSLLASSSVHEQSTDTTVFHGVVNVLSALVRLRRDLILNTLPHLGFILRRLVSCLRSLRPQLGDKQSRLVMDTLPRWIAPSQPLSAQESKALARLLTTLTTKTMIRVHGVAAETQKPESLVRPFSKHAASVITAYVEAVNDPLCVVSSAIRKELQPGLFALCDMLGEHNRDAMMVSALDTGGKATMKALWKEYEKQRYVGKG
ncbi:Urb2/Npa2 family-domain-containing protein [Trametes punicea]|nr:Urb2/Npa2 family-domain-containing protein [Trametes punicea]